MWVAGGPKTVRFDGVFWRPDWTDLTLLLVSSRLHATCVFFSSFLFFSWLSLTMIICCVSSLGGSCMCIFSDRSHVHIYIYLCMYVCMHVDGILYRVGWLGGGGEKKCKLMQLNPRRHKVLCNYRVHIHTHIHAYKPICGHTCLTSHTLLTQCSVDPSAVVSRG